MKKANKVVSDPDLRAEYDFASMTGGVRGKYAERYRAGVNLVLLEPEVRGRRGSGACSHRKEHRVEMFLGHGKAVFLEGENVAVNGLPNVCNRGFAAVPLRNAAWEAWALGYPEAVLTRINDDLPHAGRIRGASRKLKSTSA